MGWIDLKDKYPPEGLLVLVEMSGRSLNENGCIVISDHSFNLASWIVPYGSEGKWVFHGQDYSFPEVYAWMPLPEPYRESEGVCKDCYYNDGEVHAECVICDKTERGE